MFIKQFIYFISIGLNDSDGVPLDERQRVNFIDHVRYAVTSEPAATLIFTGKGLGHWEGQTEPSYTIAFTLNAPFHVRFAAESRIVSALERYAKEYRQNSIALTCARSTALIGPS